MEKQLERIDTLDLIRKIKEFRKLNLFSMSEYEIGNAISSVLCWNGVFVCPVNIKSYKQGTKFFRVKKLNGSSFPNERFSKYHDYWETNPEYLTVYGRLNKPKEALLYVCLEPLCALKEVGIGPNDFFALIRYTSVSDVKTNYICGDIDFERLNIHSDKAKINMEILNGFLRDEFSRAVGKGTEYLYKVSEKIAKDYFDLPPREIQDAWEYSSVQDKTKSNICFRPNIAHELLSVDGAMIGKLYNEEKIRVLKISDGSDCGEMIKFYDVGSDQQKKVFPSIEV